MTVSVRPPGLRKLDAVTFDQLLQTNDPFCVDKPAFDLRGIHLITPAALVGLATACHSLAAAGRRPLIVVDDIDVRNYLLRACFVSVVESVATFEPRFPT